MNANELINEIQKVFKDVTLEDGIGLWQAQAIDDYEVGISGANARKKDEKLNWQHIDKEHLNSCGSSFSFFDPKGMKFHIPAYLILELKDESDVEVIYHLTNSDYKLFSLLNDDQKNVIKKLLYFIIDDPNYEFEKPDIENSLMVFWDHEYTQ